MHQWGTSGVTSGPPAVYERSTRRPSAVHPCSTSGSQVGLVSKCDLGLLCAGCGTALESVVREPPLQATLRSLCAALSIPFFPEMLRYRWRHAPSLTDVCMSNHSCPCCSVCCRPCCLSLPQRILHLCVHALWIEHPCAGPPSCSSWQPGPRAEDGVWAPLWYQQVHQSSGFEPCSHPYASLIESRNEVHTSRPLVALPFSSFFLLLLTLRKSFLA